MRLFEAVPSYFGGKRRLAKKIMTYARGDTFVDVFLGGGSVSLLAKHLGYRVLCNDFAERSAIIGRALVENGATTIADDDVARLFAEPPADYPRFVEENYCPDYFTVKHAAFLDRAFANVRVVADPVKRDLLALLLTKYVFHVRPFGSFMVKSVTQKFEKGDVEDLVAHKSVHVERFFMPPYSTLKKFQAMINRSVMDNGRENRVFQMDALDFVREAQGDTAYFDPPYVGSSPYEAWYAVLDAILAGEQRRVEKSCFNVAGALDFFAELLSRARHIPRWIISFGGPKYGVDDILAVVRRFRDAEAVPILHRYTIGAAPRQYEACTELLVVAAQ